MSNGIKKVKQINKSKCTLTRCPRTILKIIWMSTMCPQTPSSFKKHERKQLTYRSNKIIVLAAVKVIPTPPAPNVVTNTGDTPAYFYCCEH